MTILVLFILAVVWAVYLVSWLRGKASGRRVNSIHSFSSHLSILERTAGDEPAAPPVAPRIEPLLDGQYFAPRRPQLSPVKKRRRDVLLGLAGITGVLLLATVAMGDTFVMLLFVLSAAATAAYVYQLVQLRKRAEERADRVVPIDRGVVAPEAVAPQQRVERMRPAARVDERAVEPMPESMAVRPAPPRAATDVDDVLGAVFGDLGATPRRAVGH